jgi:hypothetical protein
VASNIWAWRLTELQTGVRLRQNQRFNSSNSEYSRAPAARVNGVLRQRLSLVENLSAAITVCNRTELHYGYFPRILDKAALICRYTVPPVFTRRNWPQRANRVAQMYVIVQNGHDTVNSGGQLL